MTETKEIEPKEKVKLQGPRCCVCGKLLTKSQIARYTRVEFGEFKPLCHNCAKKQGAET